MKEKVLLGLSGGVDSAVAAILLKKQGYEVIGAFMINFSETKNKLTGECNYLQDKKEAEKVAQKLGIKLINLNFEKQYKKQVIDPMFKAYSKGLTPNPDSLCNKVIKFPLLWKEAKKLNCKYIATGHYIKKIKKDKEYLLKIPKDKIKDQSYFLYDLTQKDLKHTLFPISNLKKEEVRKIAKKNRLPNYDKKGTSGICFVGRINMKDFLKQRIKNKNGKILSPESKIIGEHQGVNFHTIGERIREDNYTKINKEFRNKYKSKMYVAKKDIRNNTITIAPKNHKILKSNSFKIKKLNLISKKTKLPLKNIKVRIRHQGELIPARIDKKLNCKLNKAIDGLASGQSCVIYQNSTDIILGGGEIKTD